MIDLKLLIISIIFVGISVAALSIKLLLKKDGKFPNTSIKSPTMRKRGILCARSQDKIAQSNACKSCINH